MPIEVAIIAKYSPQRFSSHSPTASMISITAYAPAASASRARVCALSWNACWMRPSSLEWLTLKPSSRSSDREPGSAEPPDGDGQRGEDDGPQATLDREQPQDERAAQLLSPPHPGRGRHRAAAGRLADDKGAAAQAAPGGTLGAGHGQPLAQVGLVGREGDMAASP